MRTLKNDLLLILAQSDEEKEILSEVLENIFLTTRKKIEYGSGDYIKLEQAYHNFYEVLKNIK